MTQHDYSIANASGQTVRNDINNALEAIVTLNAGATEPGTTFAHQLWLDTDNGTLSIRNASNTTWLRLPVSTTASDSTIAGLTVNGATNSTGIMNADGGITVAGGSLVATVSATFTSDVNLLGDIINPTHPAFSLPAGRFVISLLLPL